MRPSGTSSAEALALLRNTGPGGHVDPLGYEADRLVMEHQMVGGVDADAIVRDMLQSPAYRDASGRVQPGPLVEAIGARLSQADRGNFDQALDKAGVDQGLLDRAGDALSRAGSQISEGIATAEGRVSDALANSRRQVGVLADDPNTPSWLRGGAAAGERVLGSLQEKYGIQKGSLEQAGDAIVGVVDTAKLGYRFATDESFRGVVVSAAKMYAAATVEDPSKPYDDARKIAVGALNDWEKGLKEATAQGKAREYLGGTGGAVGFEAAMLIIPATKLGKVGKIAQALDRTTPDGLEAAAEIAGDASRAASKGGPAGRLAGEALDDLVDAFRQRGGRLNDFVQAAHAAGHLDDLLAHGKLAPKELTTLATRNPETFANVPFDSAWEASLKNLGPVAQMHPKMRYGDLAEAIITRDLIQQGYTDIRSIQNNSGWGVDISGRNPGARELEFFEVKSSIQGNAKSQTGDPEKIITDWLEKAAAGDRHWAPHNMEPGMAEVAESLRKEIQRNNGQLTAHWAKVNLSNDPKTGELLIDKSVERWLPPQQRPKPGKDGPDAPDDPQASIGPRTGPTGDPAFDEVFFALHSHNERAIENALKRMMATPEALAIQEEGRNALEAMQQQETQAMVQAAELNPELAMALAPEVEARRGPVLSLLHPRQPNSPDGGPDGGGDGGGGGGGA